MDIHESHSMVHRSKYSKNGEEDQECLVCHACTCHQPNRLMEECK